MAERKVSWGVRSEHQLIGKRISRIDGVDKASGKAKYAADINTQGTLHVCLLTSKHAHAKIASLNVKPAEETPGVVKVVVVKGADAEVRWEGELIAIVAAERPELAADGVRAIKIKYEVLDHFVAEADLSAAEAAEQIKPLGDQTKGDVAKALKEAAAVHTGHYGIHTITHMCMEPHGSHCEWNADGELTVHLSTQNVSGTGGQFAGPLGVEATKVTVICDYIGGGFGSKFAADQWDVECAKLAKEMKRPVRMTLDRATELQIAGNRPSAFADVTIAADANGHVTAWQSHHWGTSGAAGSTVAISQMPYVFEFENRNRKATGIKTNTGPSRAWRAPNHPQLCLITNAAMDDLAAKMKMDSFDFFKKNLDQTPSEHAPLPDIYAGEMEVAAKLMDWKAKWHPRGQGGGNGPVRRGLGMGLHSWVGRAHAARCMLKVHPDGTVESFGGSQDLGTGTRTVIAITIAETFGLPVEAVKVHIGSNKYPKSGPSGGSTTVGGVSGPNRRAALDALWKIFDLVAAKYNVSADSLTAKGGQILSGQNAVCSWKQAAALVGPMPLEVMGEGPKKDGLTDGTVGGVQMADVSVDIETGVVRVNKFVAVQDCGMVIDLKTAESQVEGAITMGIAYALMEERIMDNASGRFINADLENYKLPRIGDLGEIVVEMYQPDDQWNRGVIGLGEPPVISPGAAISNAVANAIGIRVPVLPLTPKRVLDALKGGRA